MWLAHWQLQTVPGMFSQPSARSAVHCAQLLSNSQAQLPYFEF
jgi:hypothetical protein